MNLAAEYKRRGWALALVPANDKGPRERDWDKRDASIGMEQIIHSKTSRRGVTGRLRRFSHEWFLAEPIQFIKPAAASGISDSKRTP